MGEESTAAELCELGETVSNVGDDVPQDKEQPDQEPQEAHEPSRKRGRPGTKDQPVGPVVKKFHSNFLNKSFDDITMAEVEKVVKRLNHIEKQVEAKSNAEEQLKELQSKTKALEKDIGAIGTEEVARVKRSIYKQLHQQMIWYFPMNAELKLGRSIVAYVPNVSPEMLEALGGSLSAHKQKLALRYFEEAPTRRVSSTRKSEQPLGSHLVLGAHLTLKWLKTTSELQVETTYKFGKAEKKPRKGKSAAAEEGEDAEAQEEDEAEEGVADEGEAAADENEGVALAVGGQ